MEQNIQQMLKQVKSLLTVDHILIDVVGDSSVEQSQGKIRCYCPIHGERLFRTLCIDIEDKSFKCSYTMCAGYRGGDLLTLYCMATNSTLSEAVKYWAKRLGLDGGTISPETAKAVEKPKVDSKEKTTRTFMFRVDVASKLSGSSLQSSVREYIQREIDRSFRYKRSMSIVLLQVDFSTFERKTVDKKTQEGYRKEINQVIVNAIRMADTWAHYDKDTYLILLPETESKNAELVARKIKGAILKLFKTHAKDLNIPNFEITELIHWGVSGYSPAKQSTMLTAESLLEQARQFLSRKDIQKALETRDGLAK